MMTRSETAVTNCADRLTKKIHAILTHTQKWNTTGIWGSFIGAVVMLPSRRKNGFKGKTFNPEPNFSYSRTRFSHRSLGGGRWVHLFSTNTSKNEACFLNRLVNHEYFCMTRELIWWINKNPVRFWWILHFFSHCNHMNLVQGVVPPRNRAFTTGTGRWTRRNVKKLYNVLFVRRC